MFLDVATSTSFINFGAFTAFTLVSVSVIAYYLRQRRSGHRLSVLFYVVMPAMGAIIDGFLLSQLDSNAITLGLIWLCVGVVVLGIITKGFRKAPPEMVMEEKEAALV
jgi:putrescine importer